MNIRLATESDLPLMMAWRSNPLIYQGFYTQKSPLVWEEHVKWFRSRNSDWRTFIFELDRPVGVITIGQLDHWSPEIGYYLGEISLWNKGIGTMMVQMGIDWVKFYSETHKHITHVHTTIKDDNIGSIRIVEKLGFKKVMEAREGESYWQKNLRG